MRLLVAPYLYNMYPSNMPIRYGAILQYGLSNTKSSYELATLEEK